ncbi:MAG TPA: hypothetical protein VFZ85_02215 [Jiangellaceae bacterium]
MKDLETASDLKQVLNVEAETQFHTPAVAGDVIARFEKSVERSERARSILYAITYEWKDAALASPLPALTPEAAKLLKEDPARFRDAYGDYFIAGYTSKAQFLAFANLRSRDEASLTKVAASVAAQFQQAGSGLTAEAASAIENSNKDHACEMSLDVHMSGLRDDASSTFRTHTHLSINEIPALVAQFTENAHGSRTTAKLIHFHRIDPSFPTTIELDREVFLSAEQLYDDLVDAHATLGRLPATYRAEMQQQLESIERRIAAEIPRDLSCPLETITTLAEGENGLTAWKRDANEILGYLGLWRAAMNQPNGGVLSWSPPATIEAIPPVVVRESYARPGHIDVDLAFDSRGILKRVGPAGRGYHDAELDPGLKGITLEGKRVCGYRLTTCRSGSTKGTINRTAGGIGQDNVSFHMRSDYDRGLDWTVEVFTVSADKFNFVDPDDR